MGAAKAVVAVWKPASEQAGGGGGDAEVEQSVVAVW